jgi:diguanylate cyclase (GGDEF)-like protein
MAAKVMSTRTSDDQPTSLESDEATKPAFVAQEGHVETERAISIPVPETDARASLRVISGEGAGRVIPLPLGPTLLGRSPAADVRFDDSTISRSHARVISGAEGYLLEDLGSLNGTFLRGVRVDRAHLLSGDRFQLGPRTLIRIAVADKLEREFLSHLVESSTRDPLTGTFNRRFFESRLDAELAYARRHGTKVAVLLLDIDHFKRVNDAYGHDAGDQVLRAVAVVVRGTIRAEDFLARLGGEEFAVVARAATQLDPIGLAQRVRLAVESLSIRLTGDQCASVTVSIGVAHHQECPEPSMGRALVKLADARLYRAKSGGRNAICSVG